jgi:hypothetical protein
VTTISEEISNEDLTTIYIPNGVNTENFEDITVVKYTVNSGNDITIDSITLADSKTPVEIPNTIGDLKVTSVNSTAKNNVSTSGHEHIYGSYTTTRYATCTSTGTRVATCKLCNSTDYKYISKKNHSYGDAVFTWLDNTCTASIECETCGDTLTDDCNITTEEQSDKTIYTATVELNGDTYTSTQEIAKPEETTVTTTEETTVTTTEETTVTTTETTTNETTSSEATTSTENTTTTESTTPTESTTTIATTTTTQTESTPVTTTETTTEITTTTAETTSNSVETTTPKVTVENTTITTTTEQTLAETESETTTTTENITTTSNVETSTEPTQNTIEKEFENLKLQVTLDINKSEKDTITAVLSTTDDSNIPSDIQVTVGGNPVDTRFYMYNSQTGTITFNLDAISEALAENETIEDFLNAVEIETLEDTSETTTTDEAPEIDDISNLTIKGDANGDEEVNAVDLLLAKKYVLQMVQKSEISFENADINDDGDVNSVDILMLKKYILQIIDKFD